MGRRGNGEGEIENLPSGRKRARRSKMIAGELVRESKTFDTRKEAVDWLREHVEPARAGTVGEWLTTWLGLRKPDAAPATYKSESQKVNRWLKPKLGTVKLKDLTAIVVNRFLAKMATEDGASDVERHKTGKVLKKAVRAAVANGQLPADPLKEVKLPSGKHQEKRSMTEADCLVLLAAAVPFGLEHVVRLWLDAGLRPGEMFALEWADFDQEAGTVRVQRASDLITNKVKRTKTKKGRRTIELAPSTVTALVAARPREGPKAKLVLPNGSGGYYWQANFHRYVWIPIRNAAGLEWVTPYTCRHTMATLMIRAGVPITTVSERMGHESIKITLESYAHVMEGDQKRAAAIMERILNPEVAARPPEEA